VTSLLEEVTVSKVIRLGRLQSPTEPGNAKTMTDQNGTEYRRREAQRFEVGKKLETGQGRRLGDDFYSAAALLALQSAVIPTAIPSVRLSVSVSHTGTLSRRMNIGSRGLHCEITKKHFTFLIRTMVGGDVPFHLKFVLKVTHPL